jgi:hypothetical protein
MAVLVGLGVRRLFWQSHRIHRNGRLVEVLRRQGTARMALWHYSQLGHFLAQHNDEGHVAGPCSCVH